VEIRIAYKSEVPVSAVLTLLFKDTVLYKYGCSDARFKSLGATPWLLWKAIAAAKSKGALRFDFGRTEEDNKGLLEFKNRWVPKPQELIYWKIPKTSSIDSARGWKLQMAKRAFSVMPKSLLRLTGRLLYRHVG
jgi:lipid II:glycine glycyltransferase (peptidoglycan interpeptide bridge formation enzyme)